MEFVIEYNNVVARNRNLFYFKNYCDDIEEFKEWVKYNDIPISKLEELDKELRIIFLEEKKKYLLYSYSNVQNMINAHNDKNYDDEHMINTQKYEDDDNKLKSINDIYWESLRKYHNIMQKLVDFYNDNEDYISMLSNDCDDIKQIYDKMKYEREYLEMSIQDFHMHDVW